MRARWLVFVLLAVALTSCDRLPWRARTWWQADPVVDQVELWERYDDGQSFRVSDQLGGKRYFAYDPAKQQIKDYLDDGKWVARLGHDNTDRDHRYRLVHGRPVVVEERVDTTWARGVSGADVHPTGPGYYPITAWAYDTLGARGETLRTIDAPSTAPLTASATVVLTDLEYSGVGKYLGVGTPTTFTAVVVPDDLPVAEYTWGAKRKGGGPAGLEFPAPGHPHATTASGRSVRAVAVSASEEVNDVALIIGAKLDDPLGDCIRSARLRWPTSLPNPAQKR